MARSRVASDSSNDVAVAELAPDRGLIRDTDRPSLVRSCCACPSTLPNDYAPAYPERGTARLLGCQTRA
jgi:hypothetical protein